MTVLLLAENEDNNKVLEILDKASCLIAAHVKIYKILLWKPRMNLKHEKTISTRIPVSICCFDL